MYIIMLIYKSPCRGQGGYSSMSIVKGGVYDKMLQDMSYNPAISNVCSMNKLRRMLQRKRDRPVNLDGDVIASKDAL